MQLPPTALLRSQGGETDIRKLSYPGEFATMLPWSRPGPNRLMNAYLARHRPNHETAAPVLPAGYVARDHVP
jgi:hypothetical protein